MESTQPYLCKITPQVLFQIVDYYERRSSVLPSDKEKVPRYVKFRLIDRLKNIFSVYTRPFIREEKERAKKRTGDQFYSRTGRAIIF